MDLAAALPRRQLERAMDEGERLRLTTARELQAIASAHIGHRGAARLATALARHEIGSTLTRSQLEEGMLETCCEHGLPAPQVNARVERWTADFLWPDHKLIVETDGRQAHATRRAFESDRLRSCVRHRGCGRKVSPHRRHATARSIPPWLR